MRDVEAQAQAVLTFQQRRLTFLAVRKSDRDSRKAQVAAQHMSHGRPHGDEAFPVLKLHQFVRACKLIRGKRRGIGGHNVQKNAP